MKNSVLTVLILKLFIYLIESSQHNQGSRGILDFLFSPCKCRCGLANRGARILGGDILSGYEFPWLASIKIKEFNSVLGSLINDKYVLTSASLLIGLTPFDVKVTLGSFDRCYPDVSSINYSVDAIILHPEYSPTNRAHDLGLLKLNGRVNFEKRISPICLATPGKTYLGQVATVTGWPEGPISNQSDLNCKHRKMGLPVLGQKQCLTTSEDPQYFTLDKGCIGVVGGTSGICKADAGGPVMYRNYDGVYEIMGILSDRNVCGERPGTAMYTNINDHISWLKQTTKDGCYCVKL